MKLSENQIVISKEFKETKNSININAVAGSGKTTMLLLLLSFVPKGKTALFVAFNNSIVDELKSRTDRTDVDIMTIHSYGWRCILRHYRNVKMNPDKAIAKTGEVLKKYIESQEVAPKKKGYYFYLVPKMINLLRCNLLENTIDNILALAEHHCEEISDFDAKIIKEVFDRMEKDTKQFDFTDMIYQPNVSPYLKFKKYDYVFCDESQDFSLAQQGIINGALNRKGRLITVGDPYQCQPAGTKVKTTLNGEVNIEDLHIGDKLISYDRNGKWLGLPDNYQSIRYAPTLNNIQESFYNDYLYKVETENEQSKYTYNHICMVRFNPDAWKGKYIVYLMKRETKYGVDWRIGKSKMYLEAVSGFGLRHRVLIEKADCAWILKVCEDDEKAKIWEEIYSTKYGISQKCFSTGGNDNVTFGKDSNLKLVFGMVRKYVDERVKKLFSDLKLKEQFPFYSKEEHKQVHFSRIHMFECRACNLLNDMQVLTLDEGWKDIKVTKEKYKGWVYSLDVSSKLYVADNILTHNCIYGFAGADSNSFDRLRSVRDVVSLPLSVCYRCAKRIVEEAQKIVPHISYYSEAEEGEVKWGDLMSIQPGDWIICRNLKPLVQVCLWLLKNRIKSKIRGKDIGEGLLGLINKVGAKTLSGLAGGLKAQTILLEKKLRAKGIKSPSLHPKMEVLLQKIEVLELLSDEVTTVTQLKSVIEDMFTEEVKGILLSTIHKAKGLENDRIYFLCPELLPSKYAVLPWQLAQEENLKYVAITRAKKSLIYVSGEDFKDNIKKRIPKFSI